VYGTNTLPKTLSRALTSTNAGNWLRTPPIDEMSATYQPAMAYSGHHSRHSCSGSLAQPNHLKPVMDDVRAAQQYRYPSQQIQPREKDGHHSPSAQLADTTGFHSSGPVTPVSAHADSAKMKSRRGSDTLIYHSLQLPKCISPTGGNLSDFAAQVSQFLLERTFA